MRTTAREDPLRGLEARLAHLPAPGSFAEGELESLPDPVGRYLRTSVAPGTPLARATRLRMRGSIKLGRWWIPFQARQILAPLQGFVWAACVAGLLAGSDRYGAGAGGMEWRLLGLITLIRAEGRDVSRSSAGRAGAEAVWVPTAVLPRFGVTWSSTDRHHATASYRLDENELELHYTLDEDARVRSISLDRWGDPQGRGMWRLHRFEHRLTRYSTFGSVTIPSAGRAAWLVGTARWGEGEFFRYEITDYQLVMSETSKEASR